MRCIICRHAFFNVFVAARKAIYRNYILSSHGLYRAVAVRSLELALRRVENDEGRDGLQS